MKDKGNWKYFLCYKQAFRINKKEKLNWIKYISLALIFIVIIFQILYCISVKILFPFNKNKSKREKATNKNLKNSNISLDKTYTISYKRENDKSDEQTIDLDKTFTIPYKSENDIPDDQITDTNKTFIMSEKSENYISDEQILDEGILTGKIKGITKALDLVGPKRLLYQIKVKMICQMTNLNVLTLIKHFIQIIKI